MSHCVLKALSLLPTLPRFAKFSWFLMVFQCLKFRLFGKLVASSVFLWRGLSHIVSVVLGFNLRWAKILKQVGTYPTDYICGKLEIPHYSFVIPLLGHEKLASVLHLNVDTCQSRTVSYVCHSKQVLRQQCFSWWSLQFSFLRLRSECRIMNASHKWEFLPLPRCGCQSLCGRRVRGRKILCILTGSWHPDATLSLMFEAVFSCWFVPELRNLINPY